MYHEWIHMLTYYCGVADGHHTCYDNGNPSRKAGDCKYSHYHYNDFIMSAIASQITSLTIVYSTVCSGIDQRKHQSSASLAFVQGIHRWPVNSPHKWPVTRKMFPFDDVIMLASNGQQVIYRSYVRITPFLKSPGTNYWKYLRNVVYF